MKVDVEVKKRVEVDVDILDILDEVCRLDNPDKWNIIGRIFNSISLPEIKLPEHQKVIQDFLAKKTLEFKTNSLFNDVLAFSNEKFSDVGPIESLLKLKQEADEAIIEYEKDGSLSDKAEELADIGICWITALGESKITMEEIIAKMQWKLDKIKDLEWVKQPDGTYQSVK